MAVDICDMKNFPAKKYYTQVKLGGSKSNYSYAFTRGFIIEATASLAEGHAEEGPIKGLDLTLHDYPAGTSYGTAYEEADSKTHWEYIAEQMACDESISMLVRDRNPIDFTLYDKSRIIFLLSGKFWRFSSILRPIAMKHDYGDNQYFGVRRHFKYGVAYKSVGEDEWDDKYAAKAECRCISFFTGYPCWHPDHGGLQRVFHGFSLNVDLLMGHGKGRLTAGDKEYLPVTLDPDIENKGTHGR